MGTIRRGNEVKRSFLMNYRLPEIVQLQLWSDEEMPETRESSDEELRQEIGQEKQNHHAVQLYLPGFEPEESD